MCCPRRRAIRALRKLATVSDSLPGPKIGALFAAVTAGLPSIRLKLCQILQMVIRAFGRYNTRSCVKVAVQRMLSSWLSLLNVRLPLAKYVWLRRNVVDQCILANLKIISRVYFCHADQEI